MLKLTIYYDGQFYVGIVETVAGNTLKAYRHVFGQDPNDQEILEFINRDLLTLIDRSNQKGVHFQRLLQKKINPKKLQKMVAKERKQGGISTKAQEAVKEAYVLRKKEKAQKTKQLRDEHQQYKRERKLQKKKNKHKGR